MKIDEYNRVLEILCYRLRETIDPKTLIENIRKSCSPATTQLLDADTIAGNRHLFFATLNAMKRFVQGRAFSHSLDVEILLSVSTQKQIEEAVRMNGIRRQTKNIAIVLVADSTEIAKSAVQKLESLISGDRDQTVLDRIDKKKIGHLIRSFGISCAEFEALTGKSDAEKVEWLIVERTAILDTKR